MENIDVKDTVVEEIEAMDINAMRHMYCNNVMVNSGLYDFNLLLNQILPEYNSEGIVVSMSPQHAKALNTILKAALDGYEKQYGKIPEMK